MQRFGKLTSPFVVLAINDIDTDQIIPARFLKGTDKKGLGEKLFCDWRYDDQDKPKTDFILNQPQAKRAEILVAGDNFGCGSSREHAAWALLDFGFRAIISSGFADIFRNNSLKNGLLPVVVDPVTLNTLYHSSPSAELTIDLQTQQLLLPDGHSVPFPIDAFNKTCLLQGIDTLEYLLSQRPLIDEYEQSHPARVRTA